MPLKSLIRCRPWRLALFALAGVTSLHALTLGEPRVLSEPDMPLVAELPLRQLGRVSLEQLRARLAPQAAWQAAGIQPASDTRHIDISLSEQNGEPVVRIQTPVALSVSTLDLLIELQWPQGRLQREVGLLLKAAPGNRAPFVSAPTALLVQPGDTASALGLMHLDPSASMPQALAALVQANPDAFVQGNVNRLRAGAVLKLPDAQQIQSVEPDQARQWMAQQLEAFAAYRSELTEQAPEAATDAAPQVATGKIQPAQKQVAQGSADRLTLSTSADDGADQIAIQRQAQQTAERAAELNRNIQELNRIAQGGDQTGLPITTPGPKSETSELIWRWVQSPYTPWAAIACIALLLSWIVLRVFRARASDLASSSPAALSSTSLKVDFDLDLPQADSLPPLPDSVHEAPTPVLKEATQGAASTASWTGVNLDLPDPVSQTLNDPDALRLDLAQALWQRGLTQTALVLAREVMTQSQGASAQRARLWLEERA